MGSSAKAPHPDGWTGTLGLADFEHTVATGVRDPFDLPGGPDDFDHLSLRIRSQSKMHRPDARARVAYGRGDVVELVACPGSDPYKRADGIAVAACSRELQIQPV